MQIIQISEAKSSDLLTFFNANVVRLQDGKPTKKWTDRASAEKRVNKLVESLASYFVTGKEGVDYPPEGCIMFPEADDEEVAVIEPSTAKPVDKIDLEADKAAGDPDEAEEEDTDQGGNGTFAKMGAALNGLADKGTTATTTTRSSSIGRASNSAGVAASWMNPGVREARLTRDGVTVEVDGEEVGSFKSTGEAWRTLGLPEGKHIRFRLKLKASLKESYEFGGKVYTFLMGGEPADE